MTEFDYPPTPLQRKHGPQGYPEHGRYRPWLRDEFSFRCVYCLSREQWGRALGEFEIDHFVPQKFNPDQAAVYDNLVYSCARCNRVKSAQNVPDPMTAFMTGNLRIQPDGTLESYSPDAESLVLKLDLNSSEMVEWRLLWIRIIELAREHDLDLHRRLMGFPANLPNLGRHRPPGGNSRPDGITNSYFALRARGELPAIY